MYYRHSYTTSDALASSMASSVMLLAVFALALVVYLLVKAVRLVTRVFIRYPHNQALWVAFTLMLASWGAAALALLTAPGSLLAGGLVSVAALAAGALVLIARIVELVYEQRFQQEHVKGALVTDVLTRPWWTPAAAA